MRVPMWRLSSGKQGALGPHGPPRRLVVHVRLHQGHAESARRLAEALLGRHSHELRASPPGSRTPNYFVTTTSRPLRPHAGSSDCRTEPAFYLGLMAHLAHQRIPARRRSSDHSSGLHSILNGKPAALVTAPGRRARCCRPEPAHCAQWARSSPACTSPGQSFPGTLRTRAGRSGGARPRPWWARFSTYRGVSCSKRSSSFSRAIGSQDLPRGPIHADLFRDNVLWDDGRIGGLVDFYFAGWTRALRRGSLTLKRHLVPRIRRRDRRQTRPSAARPYHAARPVHAIERGAWPAMLARGASLRFWLSRLHDFPLPRPGELVPRARPSTSAVILELRIRRCARTCPARVRRAPRCSSFPASTAGSG